MILGTEQNQTVCSLFLFLLLSSLSNVDYSLLKFLCLQSAAFLSFFLCDCDCDCDCDGLLAHDFGLGLPDTPAPACPHLDIAAR
jgi:hypothetical protein